MGSVIQVFFFMSLLLFVLLALIIWLALYLKEKRRLAKEPLLGASGPDKSNENNMIYEPLLAPSRKAREVARINKSFANYGSSSLAGSHSSHQQQLLAVSPRHRVPSISTLANSFQDSDSNVYDFDDSTVNELYTQSESSSPYTPFEFSSVGLGVFAQDDPSTCADTFNYLTHDFGLILSGSWPALDKHIDQLQAKADDEYDKSNGQVQTFYKLLFVARHGQGYHNLAIEIYGEPKWDEYWSKLNGDGNIVWGPDPDLTPLGIEQAKRNNIAWKKQILTKNAPVPSVFFVSPFTRAVDTAKYTWMKIKPRDANSEPASPISSKDAALLDALDLEEDLPEKKSLSYHALVVEDLRETIGVHTCDKRSTKSEIHATHRGLVFEPGFSEPDNAWLEDYRETPEEQNVRICQFLSRLFDGSQRYKNAVLELQKQNSGYQNSSHNLLDLIKENNVKPVPELVNAKYVSVTAHSGTINSILAVTGHRKFNVFPGGMIPVLVKATRHRKDGLSSYN